MDDPLKGKQYKKMLNLLKNSNERYQNGITDEVLFLNSNKLSNVSQCGLVVNKRYLLKHGDKDLHKNLKKLVKPGYQLSNWQTIVKNVDFIVYS